MATSQQLLAAFPVSSSYPEPVVVPPRQLPHKQSVIILHGRGDTARNFAPSLMETAMPDGALLADVFPHARFVFPGASLRRAASLKRIPLNQWFDMQNIKQQEKSQELQIEGLRETSAWIHILMTREIERVGPDNVVLGGLSQGCAASLTASLLWEGPAIGGVFGMCGWLPLRLTMVEGADLQAQMEGKEIDHMRKEAEDIWQTLKKHNHGNPEPDSINVEFGDEGPVPSSSDDSTLDVHSKVVATLREYLELTPAVESRLPYETTPLFVGHGSLDSKVPPALSRHIVDFFTTLEVDVTFKEYPRLGHWYSPEMLRDVVDFIHQKTDWNRPT